MNPLPPSALMRPRVQPPAWTPAPPRSTYPTPASTARVGSFYVDHKPVNWKKFLSILKEISIIQEATALKNLASCETDNHRTRTLHDIKDKLNKLKKLCTNNNTETPYITKDLWLTTVNRTFGTLRLLGHVQTISTDNGTVSEHFSPVFENENPLRPTLSTADEVKAILEQILGYLTKFQLQES
jgi:hypothetical protein